MLIVRMWFVLLSNVMVRAPFIVSRFCSTSNVVGLFSLTIVSVPLPCVLNASIVDGLNAAPSDPPASGSVVRILPSVALMMTIVGFGGCAGGLPEMRARREQHVILVVEREAVAAADIAERIVRGRLHRLGVDDGDAALRVLHDDVNRALAVGDRLFGDAAEIDRADHRAILRVDDDVRSWSGG